ncbi:hypothetical protein [Rheinheimera oceanensis]|uniref:hypothetical protein n=1 Tax=Rheinheimera oceanensis TaxID=2817449 RepID=UPI001BFCE2D9|nr:hypothetical protein [Rheinheimera oceanensis]
MNAKISVIKTKKLELSISLIAILISFISLYYSIFYKSPSLKILIRDINLHGYISHCKNENHEGICLKFETDAKVLLLNSGNTTTTFYNAVVNVPDPKIFITQGCNGESGSNIPTSKDILIILQPKEGKVTNFKSASHEFIDDPKNYDFTFTDNDYKIYLCLETVSIDHIGREHKSRAYLGEFYIERDKEQFLVHTSNDNYINIESIK